MQGQVVLIALAGAAFDLAGQPFSPNVDPHLGADSCAVDGRAIACELDLEPMV